jgi:hypothetical protein
MCNDTSIQVYALLEHVLCPLAPTQICVRRTRTCHRIDGLQFTVFAAFRVLNFGIRSPYQLLFPDFFSFSLLKIFFSADLILFLTVLKKSVLVGGGGFLVAALARKLASRFQRCRSGWESTVTAALHFAAGTSKVSF